MWNYRTSVSGYISSCVILNSKQVKYISGFLPNLKYDTDDNSYNQNLLRIW